MFDAVREARVRALAGEGPTLIEAVTMRMHGHAAHDDMKYVPKEQVEEWRKRDPIERQETRLRSLGVDVDALRAEVLAEIEAATEEALAAPMPDPATATEGVFCEGEAEALGDGVARWSGFVGEAVSADAVSGDAVSGRAVSGDAVSGRAVSGDAASGRAVSGDAVSGRAVSGEAVS
jgi:pyruvate dehydrogenase E1 component alpha subunit